MFVQVKNNETKVFVEKPLNNDSSTASGKENVDYPKANYNNPAFECVRRHFAN